MVANAFREDLFANAEIQRQLQLVNSKMSNSGQNITKLTNNVEYFISNAGNAKDGTYFSQMRSVKFNVIGPFGIRIHERHWS